MAVATTTLLGHQPAQQQLMVTRPTFTAALGQLPTRPAVVPSPTRPAKVLPGLPVRTAVPSQTLLVRASLAQPARAVLGCTQSAPNTPTTATSPVTAAVPAATPNTGPLSD